MEVTLRTEEQEEMVFSGELIGKLQGGKPGPGLLGLDVALYRKDQGGYVLHYVLRELVPERRSSASAVQFASVSELVEHVAEAPAQAIRALADLLLQAGQRDRDIHDSLRGGGRFQVVDLPLRQEGGWRGSRAGRRKLLDRRVSSSTADSGMARTGLDRRCGLPDRRTGPVRRRAKSFRMIHERRRLIDRRSQAGVVHDFCF